MTPLTLIQFLSIFVPVMNLIKEVPTSGRRVAPNIFIFILSKRSISFE
uniref:Uncharacterized protein n=1 Tax=Lepeophtheirus salmonis TaxID=72036 RepID=A0A0K2VFF2_LEPSM